MNTDDRAVFHLALSATVLAFVVVVLGAYVRLSHAGLGCPDWPGCYGHIGVPLEAGAVAAANEVYPERPVVAHKAWKEMLHRYAAAALGIFILVITMIAWRFRTRSGVVLPTVLMGLVIMQGMLGMWTVTLLLKPLIVTLHLLGGMLTLALLFLLALKSSRWQPVGELAVVKGFLYLCLAALGLQIASGGWVSSNYSALACYGFPQCNLEWLPDMDFTDGFVLWRGLGIDYEGGVLNHPARVAIHMTHRFGAVMVFVLLSVLVVWLLRRSVNLVVKRMALLLALLLVIQLSLGVANVTLGLPLQVASAHNAVAALLLLTLVGLLFGVRQAQEI